MIPKNNLRIFLKFFFSPVCDTPWGRYKLYLKIYVLKSLKIIILCMVMPTTVMFTTRWTTGSPHLFCFSLLMLAFQIYFCVSLCSYYIKYLYDLKVKSIKQKTFRGVNFLTFLLYLCNHTLNSNHLKKFLHSKIQIIDNIHSDIVYIQNRIYTYTAAF